MIPLKLIMVRVPIKDGVHEMIDHTVICINPARVDTLTVISDGRRAAEKGPALADAKTIVRYNDDVSGYRLFYVEDTVPEITRAMHRWRIGEDPNSLDFEAIGAT